MLSDKRVYVETGPLGSCPRTPGQRREVGRGLERLLRLWVGRKRSAIRPNGIHLVHVCLVLVK